MISAPAKKGKHRLSDSTKEREATEKPAAQRLQMEIALQIQQDATTVFIVGHDLSAYTRLVSALRTICVKFSF